ncbi:hypothetical protein QBC37DRAFT_288422 [Rhypophila decipiens]|uniref:WD-like domain-containing protein n=1 Tax=Rhypophila decipiens TaxID=261697 RepID=A0AAN7B4B1_9PEZI|nr:hypothetical protein QBC37DRAFT_288422 [Rhypophila decipiens]
MQLRNIILSALLAWPASAAAMDSSPENNMISKRVEDLECDIDHAPNRDDCEELKNRIQANMIQKSLQSSPRYIVYNSCYVSWSDAIVGQAPNLLPYIIRIQSNCQNNIDRSGIIKNISILGQLQKCAVCLSNRATGCSN